MRLLFVGHGFRPFHTGGLIAYAEQIMQAHAARGHEVTYFCSGRDYGVGANRVRRFEREGVQVRELISSPIVFGGNAGTRRPELEMEHPPSEEAFRCVLRETRPDVVHFHEVTGLPSSLLDIAREAGGPVVMDLHDYFPICPVAKLFDADDQRCRRQEPAPQCVRCNADAGMRARRVLDTLAVHRREIEEEQPWLAQLPRPGALMLRVRRARQDRAKAVAAVAPGPPPPPEPPMVEAFARRREVNVRRLSGLDRLVAASPQVADIYAELGVDRSRLTSTRFTLPAFERLEPRQVDVRSGPVRFLTLAGCATISKGAEVVADALERLEELGLTPQDLTLTIAGDVDRRVEERIARSALARPVGRYEPEALADVLGDHHVGLVPSVWDECLGFVGIEMLAAGMPVIGNAVGGIPEYTRDGETGWLNRDLDGAGLARIMAGIVRAPEEIGARSAGALAARADLVPPFAGHVREVEAMYGELVATRA